jgi:vitamin B12 transporter
MRGHRHPILLETHSMRTFVTVLAGVLLLVAPCLTAAQQRPDTTSLSPVVVTATKVPSAAPTSTAATTVIRASDLRAKGITTMADALREVPGVMVNAASGLGSQTALFLRGGNSNFTKVLIDGVPVNMPGGALDLSTLAVDNIDRIEVVRGPASVQYGSDAMTGVVQIFTRHEGRSVLDVRAGMPDHAGDATVELVRASDVSASGRRFFGSIGAGHHRSDGFLPFNNDYHATNASALIGAEGQRGRATLASSLGDSRYQYPTTGSGEPTDSNAWTGARRATLSLGGTLRFNAFAGARLQAGSSFSRALSDNQPDNLYDTTGFYSHSQSDARRDAGDVQLYAALPNIASLTAGIAGERQRVKSAGRSMFARIPLPDTRFDESRTNRAVYAQLAGGARALSFDAGVRGERFGTGRGATTGRLGIASELLPRTILRASLGTAFKEAALDELYATAFSEGNRDLLPERNRSREIGAELRLPGEWVTLGATVFDQRFRNLVQYQFRGPGIADFYNVVAARARGLELEARLADWQRVSVHGSYTLLHTEVTDPGDGGFGTLERGKSLVRRPERSASIAAGWHDRRLSANAMIAYVGGRDDVDFGQSTPTRVRLDPYTKVDLAGSYAILGGAADTARNGALSVTARVENATDVHYENVAGYRTPGRMLYLGLRAVR